MEAAFYEKRPDGSVQCRLCPHHCVIAPGRHGRCRVRENRKGILVPLTYGEVASIALDPMEKKPLYHFFPGHPILSIGTWGCNLTCSFCQNYTLSQERVPTLPLSPQALVEEMRKYHSVGVAYTYNEPLIAYEYLLDAGRAVREAGGKNVLVTNGMIEAEPLEALLPWVDAMNIDLKSFREDFYRTICGGALAPILRTIERAAKDVHVEITTLVIPGYNDTEEEIRQIAEWIATHCGRATPFHLSAHYPRYRLKAPPTPETTLLRAYDVAKAFLDYVYLGNVRTAKGSDTFCVRCGARVIARWGYQVDLSGMNADGTCRACGASNGIHCHGSGR